MPYIVGDPEALPAPRVDAEGRPCFFFRLREYRHGRWKSKTVHPVYAYVPREVADLIAPGQMAEVEGDHVDIVRPRPSGTRIDQVFRADSASPREWEVEEDLPDTQDLAAG